jgi:hypothetical protein
VILLSSVDALELVCSECDGNLSIVLVRLLSTTEEIAHVEELHCDYSGGISQWKGKEKVLIVGLAFLAGSNQIGLIYIGNRKIRQARQ